MFFNVLTIPLAPSDRLQQEAAASLCTGTADPSAADYLLAALIFAWHFNGDVAALKRWCSDAKGALGNLAHQGRAQWRKELAAVMKCQNEHVLAMAAHAMSAHFSVDIPALYVENYMKMHAQGKVLKPDAYSRLKPRMTAGDAAHFAALITAVENLTTEQRNRMAGSEDKMPTPPRPRAGGYKKKQLSYEQLEELSASYKSERDAEIASRRKADTRHAEKVEKPKAASAAGNDPWHAAYGRARGAGRRIAGLGQGGGQMLVAAFARVHTLLGDIHRARGTLRLTRRLVRHSSPVPGVNGPRKAIPHVAAR